MVPSWVHDGPRWMDSTMLGAFPGALWNACVMAGAPAGTKSFNKIALPLAGHRFFPLWVVLKHRGRRTGKEYSVPLAVIPTATSFIIAMPWGRETDWVRNVRAAGACTVRWKGVDYVCTDPTFVDKGVALAARAE